MYKILKFDRGRNCLKYLVQEYSIKEIYIPYYLCDIIRHTLFETGCKINYYHIDDNFMPEADFPKMAYILYPNYFGICTNNVKTLVERYPNIIIDNAHAYYEEPLGFASFNSGIKFGYGENAYLWIKTDSLLENEVSPIINKEWQKKCRKKFWEVHKTYSGCNMIIMNIMNNYEKIGENNFCPFCYPLLMESEEKADKIVKSLTEEGYTIYRYWNLLPESYNEYKFYSRLIPVPTTLEVPNSILQDSL